MTDCLIGVDVGTQGIRAVAFDTDGNRIASAGESLSLCYGADGSVTQDPDTIYGKVLSCIGAVYRKSDIPAARIVGIGLGAQMAGIIGVDENLEPTMPYDSWLDTRCVKYAEKMRLEAEDEIIRLTGGQVGNAHGAKILWHRSENREVWQRTRKFLTLTAYLTARLCGLKASECFLDDTHLHFSGFADAENRCWSRDLLSEFRMTEEKLPQIRESTARAGGLSDAAAEQTGLPSGIPVSVGMGDTAASILGAGINAPGQCFDIAGTASVFAGCTDRFAPDRVYRTLNCMRSPILGLWYSSAYIPGGGLCLRWFRDLTGKSYAELDSLAEKSTAGGDGLLFVPQLDSPNGIRGGFIGLKWTHTAGHLWRAVLESVAREYRIWSDMLSELLPELRYCGMTGVGGGAESRIFGQIKADYLGMPYLPTEEHDTATWGAAISAGCAAGLFSNPGAVKMPVAHGFLSPGNTDAYERDLCAYRSLVRFFTDKTRRGE